MVEQLWSPWRMEYITRDEGAECVFCAAAAGIPVDNARHRVLAARPDAFVIVNKYPYSYGHILVCPRRHVRTPGELTGTERTGFFALVADAQIALSGALSARGMNLGMNLGKDAGAGIDDHMHMHLIPRWQGDTNFMPLIAECRVIPAHLDTTFQNLTPAFQRI